MHNIQIKGKKCSDSIIECPRIYIDGKEIPLNTILSASYSISPNVVSFLELELFGFPEIDTYGEVIINVTPTNVKEACKILRNELLKHGDLYDGFKASIISALKETGFAEDIRDVADRTLKRIIGEEPNERKD